MDSNSKARIQHLAFGYLSLAMVLMAGAQFWIDPAPFWPFLGRLNPIAAVGMAAVTGFFLLSYLMAKTPFAIYKRLSPKSYGIVTGIAVLFGIEVIAADVWLVDYPADINVALPDALLFYPVIGYIVEVFFHVLPIAVIVLILTRFRKLSIHTIMWVSILTVAIVEPLYQMGYTGEGASVTTIYTGVHVFLFSLAQLLVFKRFGFFTMYLFRIVFYAIWHVGWGYFRLELLF